MILLIINVIIGYAFSFDPDPRTRNTVWSVIIGGFFQWLAIYGGSQAQMQRVLACPTLRNAQMYQVLF